MMLPAVLVGLVLAVALRHAARKHGGTVLLWRWLSGHALDGAARTNAGWFAPGDKVMTPTGRASRWHHMPRAQRAAWRLGGTLAILEAAYGLKTHRAGAVHALGAAAVLAGAWASWAAWRTARAWRHNRQNVTPLHHALGAALGMPAATRPASWLTVPVGYQRQQGAKITVRLPKRFAGAADLKRAVEGIICAKLALESPTVTWQLHGANPTVELTVQIPPPRRVRLADILDHMQAAAESAPILGIGRAGKPVAADLDGDSPHVLVSAGSGGGKSVTSRALITQILNRGGLVLILDVKRLSHAWARGLPNVRYCRDVAQIHDALIWLSGEVDRRNRAADDGADEDGATDHVDIGPRLVVLAEEMNATINRLAAYWRSIKTQDDPSTSPAIEALADCLFMGRQVKVNVLAVAQMLTARTIGGPEARENMGVRILARYTMNNWRILVPEIWPPPKSSRHSGRVQVCVAGEARETQVAFLSAREAKALATSGIVSEFPADDGAAVSTAAAGSSAPGMYLTGHGAPVGLAEATAKGILPISLEAARKARQRDPEFPPARGKGGSAGELLYDPAELSAWAANRPRSAAAV
jgi:hypothetical protein